MSAARRILILGEGFSHDAHYGKTMRGIIAYGRDPVVAILDSKRAGATHEGIPIVATVDEALRFDPTVAIVGVATSGGRFPPAWREILKSCIAAGLDVESGLHEFVTEDEELAGLARQHGVRLHDFRKPPEGGNVPTGANLEVDATIVLTVGSDCAIGKKTVAIELDRAARERGLRSIFVPTGQTGIAITGWGIAVDAVVSDFLAGTAEHLVVEGVKRGGDLVFVEGQGSLVHPMYSGVTLGLMHGSAPHAFVLCHKAGSTEIEGCPGHPIPPLPELIELHERISLPARKAKVVAVALNTGGLADEEAAIAIERVATETGLPTDDPVRFGGAALLDAILSVLPTAEQPRDGTRLVADRGVCVGAGMCVLTAPELFEQDAELGLVVVKSGRLEGDALDVARSAVGLCPSGALSLETDAMERGAAL